MSDDVEKKKYGVVNADCLEAMKKMPDNCVDAVVTDPPYGLSFMGKDWDHGVPGVEFWKEALRIAKPGAHLLSFGGTRTFHRIACAIEDAGWEIRDTIMWVYGCLSEDTEILTETGWAKIGTIKIGDYAITYDFTTRNFRTERVENTYLYNYDDIAYNIVSDTTDQLVSRNHRVVVEQGGMETIEYAENLAREQTICVPVLESLPDVWNDIPMSYERTGDKEQLLHNGLFKNAFQVNSQEAQGTCSKHGMCQMRKGVLHSTSMEEEGKGTLLFQTMQRKGESSSCTESKSTSSGETEENRRGETTSEGKVYGGEEPSMERGSDANTPAWKLQGNTKCDMPKRIRADGKEEWICGGTSSCCGIGSGKTSVEDGGCTSCQPQPNGQSVGESDAIQVKQGSQDVRGAWKSTTTMARIVPVHYTGMIWCVSVQSGVIIARRNGKVFITGNSGFPKSMDISKAIDKKLGAKRTEVVGTRHRNVKPFDDGNGWNSNNTTGDYQYMAPASEEAKKWSGWGTCLKPAYEPVIMARKPLEGTVADTVLKYGTGGINIDECRVPYESDADKDSAKPQGVATAKVGALAGGLENDNTRTTFTPKQTNGRFPANIIHDGSEEVVSLFPESNGGAFPKSSNTPAGKHYEGGWGKVNNGERKEMDSGSAARFFYTIKPECEPVIMARKPIEGTVADNVLKYGTGGINIDECRVSTTDNLNGGAYCKDGHREKGLYGQDRDAKGSGMFAEGKTCDTEFKQPSGRFPANIIHDGSEEVVELFPDNVKGGTWNNTKGARHFENNGKPTEYTNKGSDNSVGSAARFFYCPKASKSEKGKDNPHPTVKPLELMKYLIKMVAPKGALVLDPFMGSGSTGVAAVQIDRRFIGIEKEEEYFNYAKKRIEAALPKS